MCSARDSVRAYRYFPGTTGMTKNYLCSNIFHGIITMRDESCIPVMMRLIGEGRPVILSGRFAVLLVLPVVLLWAMMGYGSPAPAYIVVEAPGPAEPGPVPAGRTRCMRGIFSGNSDSAGDPRTLFAR